MISLDLVATGNNIKKLIKDRNLKISDVQFKFGFNTPQSIYCWMRGEKMPSIDNLVILADILNCKLDDIIITNKYKGG